MAAICHAPCRSAQDYVHLVFKIGAHEKGYVDAHFGPPEWRIEAQAHSRNISELKAEADRIQSALSAMDMSAQQPRDRRRNAWLRANVASTVAPRHNTNLCATPASSRPRSPPLPHGCNRWPPTT